MLDKAEDGSFGLKVFFPFNINSNKLDSCAWLEPCKVDAKFVKLG